MSDMPFLFQAALVACAAALITAAWWVACRRHFNRPSRWDLSDDLNVTWQQPTHVTLRKRKP